MITGTVHKPKRPSWTCLGCGEDWPCRPAKAVLIRLDPIDAAELMAACFVQAADDLPDVEFRVLQPRFLPAIPVMLPPRQRPTPPNAGPFGF